MMLVGEDFVNYIQRDGHAESGSYGETQRRYAEYSHTAVCGYDGEVKRSMTGEV
jgi:hypothetical protein